MLVIDQALCALPHPQKPCEVSRTDTLSPSYGQGIQNSQNFRGLCETAQQTHGRAWAGTQTPDPVLGGTANVSRTRWHVRDVNRRVYLGAVPPLPCLGAQYPDQGLLF